MDLGPALAQPGLQGLQRQFTGERLAQIPTADAAGEHVQQDRQVDVLLGQMDVGDIGTPHLIRPHHLAILQQIGIRR